MYLRFKFSDGWLEERIYVLVGKVEKRRGEKGCKEEMRRENRDGCKGS